MNQIFIGGGGDKYKAESLDQAYKASVMATSQSPTCLYVPHAMEKSKHKDAYEWFTDSYNFFDSVTLLKDTDDIHVDYSSIYMGGGYCHSLRDYLQRNGMDKGFFQDFIKGGGTLYGGSAGGVVLGKTLMSSREVMLRPEEFMPLQHDGFDLCMGLSFRPHYRGEDTEIAALEHLASTQKIGIIALGEASGVIFGDDGEYTIINPESTFMVEQS